MLPIVVSDAIHNMRAALDYMVFELARHDSGIIQNGTQFLIEDFKVDPLNPKRGFDARKGKCLKGLSARHINMIEALQPYNGVDWTKTLRDISNPDKHRELTVMTDKGYYTITYRGEESVAAKFPCIDLNDWEVDAGYAIYISPPDLNKPALMPTLRRLQTEISRTYELFEDEF